MRNIFMNCLVGALIITFSILTFFGISTANAEITLRYANFPPAPTFPCVQMERWAKEVMKRTNGKVKVQTFPGGTLLDAQNMYEGVKSGLADIGCSCPAYMPGRFPLISGIDQPVGFKTCEASSLIFWTLVDEFRPASLRDFKVVTVFTSAPSYIATIKPVRKLEDLKGLQVRAAGNMVDTIEALGASPVGMPMSELPEALQKGVVKGYAASLEVLKDFKFAEIVKYVADYSLGTVSFAVLMNKQKWESLDPEVQEVIDGLSREQAIWTGRYMDDHVKEAVRWAKVEEGLEVVSLSDEEKARWKSRLEPVIQNYVETTEKKGLPGKAFLERLYELKAEVEGGPEDKQ